MTNRFLSAFLTLTILAAGCGSGNQENMTPTPSPVLITSTPRATAAVSPSQTPPIPPPLPTTTRAALIDGVTTAQINIRLEPSTGSAVLGVIPAEMRVEITGKDPGGNWWQINYPQAADGRGWVASQYVTAGDTSGVPVVGGSGTDPNGGSVAVIQQQINVRSGPGTDFNSLGTLNPQDVVNLTGKGVNGAWLQIAFEGGPEGRGWISAAFVQAQGAENLPIIAESGQVLGTGTPTGVPPTPTPTVSPAWEEGDSAESPLASVIFEPTGTRAFIYKGDVSVPEGDSEDWIAFEPYESFVFVSLECNGSNTIQTQLLENTLPLTTDIKCGDDMEELAVKGGVPYLIHLSALPSAAGLQYTSYRLSIKTRP